MDIEGKILVAIVVLSLGRLQAQETKITQIDSVKIRKSRILRQPKNSEITSGRQLENASGENLANVLKQLSGVNILQSGANISKPVIQGLTNQRIAIINNGIKLESQLWSSDHAPEIDPNLASQIEVIKGSDAVRYGSNALGGVIVMKNRPLPFFGEKIGGNARMVGQSNNSGFGGNLMLHGAAGAFAWRVQGSGKRLGDYKTADYYVNNTAARELNFSGSLGYKMPYETAEVFYSHFFTNLGVFMGSRIGSADDWNLRLRLGRPPVVFPQGFEIQAPNQKVNHHLAKFFLQSDRPFGKTEFNYAYQKNHRKEFDRRTGPLADRPVLDVELETHSGTLDYERVFFENFKTRAGVAYSHQKNFNIPGTGVNSILPNFVSNNAGVWLSEEFKKNSWVATGGIRYDFKDFSAAGYNRYGEYYGGQRDYSSISYELGIQRVFGNGFSAATSIGKAWRAPEAVELFSNGLDHGSALYLLGDENLKTEKGLKWTARLQYETGRLYLSAEGFLQKIDGFIYEMPTGEYKNTWGGLFPLFVYRQSDALLKGADAELRFQISERVKYQAVFSSVYADNRTEEFYFPNISPERLSQNIEFSLDRLTNLRGGWLRLEHQWVNKQRRFSAETDLLPDSPPGYHLFGAGIGTQVSTFRKDDMALSLQANNLFNKLYKDYTNRFRYFAHEMGRNLQFRVSFNF